MICWTCVDQSSVQVIEQVSRSRHLLPVTRPPPTFWPSCLLQPFVWLPASEGGEKQGQAPFWAREGQPLGGWRGAPQQPHTQSLALTVLPRTLCALQCGKFSRIAYPGFSW